MIETYNKWVPVEGIENEMWVEALHDDYEGVGRRTDMTSVKARGPNFSRAATASRPTLKSDGRSLLAAATVRPGVDDVRPFTGNQAA